jgi:hypothetical protein
MAHVSGGTHDFGLAEWLSQDMTGADVVIRFEERRSAAKQNTELIDTDLCSPALPKGRLDDKTMSDQWTSPRENEPTRCRIEGRKRSAHH